MIVGLATIHSRNAEIREMRICDGCNSANDVKTMIMHWDGVRSWDVYEEGRNSIDLCGDCRSHLYHSARKFLKSKHPKVAESQPESSGSTQT